MFLNDPRQVIFSLSPSLCKPFGVSDEVAEKRIEREGLLEIACKELF
jgi:hypothetical protein